MDQETILEAMRDGGFYPGAPQRVETIETHISTLFLTDRFVYKVKKPVDFGFLDFTSLSARKFFCQQERDLNQRLSQGVYLEVLPIFGTDEGFSLEPGGAIVEYTLKMRRLPQDRMMETLLEKGAMDKETIRRIALHLISFHSRARTDAEISLYGTASRIAKNTDENFAQTRPSLGITLTKEQYGRISKFTQDFIKKNRLLFKKRIDEKKIRDCHGDIRMEHICIEDPIVIFDCVEFNRRFRYSDVAADIAFLAMDLDFHDAPELSRYLLQVYVDYTRDIDLLRLIRFYKCYRAYVRGKVESFRAGDQGLAPSERGVSERLARKHFRLADAYARCKPSLIITSGLTGTGKSRLAASLAQDLDASLFQSDRIRKEMTGIPLEEHQYEALGQGIYSEEISRKTYEALRFKAEQELKDGRSVILDATFLKQGERDKARDLAERMEIPFFVIEVTCAEDEVRERLFQRMRQKEEPSDGRWEIYLGQKMTQDPIRGIPSDTHYLIDTTQKQDLTLEVEKFILLATET